MIIVIYASDELKFANNKKQLIELGYSSDKVLFADSKQFTRLDIIKKNLHQLLFFMDHDCMLNKEQSLVLNSLANKMTPKNQIVAGVYADSPDSQPLQKAHNWIANTWLKESYENKAKYPVMLGGVFLVYANDVNFEKDLGVGVWGAEDKHLARVLKNAEFDFMYEPQLQVVHETTLSIKHFLKRAYLHGVNDVKYFTQYPQGSSFLYWLRKIDYSDVRLVALVALHFFVQRVAKIFQKFRQLSK